MIRLSNIYFYIGGPIFPNSSVLYVISMGVNAHCHTEGSFIHYRNRKGVIGIRTQMLYFIILGTTVS